MSMRQAVFVPLDTNIKKLIDKFEDLFKIKSVLLIEQINPTKGDP